MQTPVDQFVSQETPPIQAELMRLVELVEITRKELEGLEARLRGVCSADNPLQVPTQKAKGTASLVTNQLRDTVGSIQEIVERISSLKQRLEL